MGRRWFGDPADEAVLGATLARLVEDVSRLLDRLEGTPVVPGAARVDPEAGAVVLPLRHVPGASLVVQVAEWSSSVGCWWSTAGEPTTGPAAEQLFAELPLRPDGPGRAVAWLERELRRPVTERVAGYGVAHRQVWSVVLDDGRELAVRSRWLPGWTAPGSGLAVATGAERGPVPGAGRVPAWLPVAAGAGWTLDIVVGLGWLLAAARDHPAEALAWDGAPTVALREAALALAVLVLLAVIDRRPATTRAGLAGAALLVVANSFAVQAGVSALVGLAPQALWFPVASTITLAAWFGGAALLAVAVRAAGEERHLLGDVRTRTTAAG